MIKVFYDRFRKKENKNLCSKEDYYVRARVVIRVDGLKWTGEIRSFKTAHFSRVYGRVNLKGPTF